MYYVYVLKSLIDGSLYIGYSSNLKRRFEEHNKKMNISTRYKAPFKLIYYEAYASESDAEYREKNLKRFSQAYNQLKKRIANSLI
mgnify:CR=1